MHNMAWENDVGCKWIPPNTMLLLCSINRAGAHHMWVMGIQSPALVKYSPCHMVKRNKYYIKNFVLCRLLKPKATATKNKWVI